MCAEDMKELQEICRTIVERDQAVETWRKTESDDEFQSEHFCGGYDSNEDAFCFSFYSRDSAEYWFQLTVDEVARIAAGKTCPISLRVAET